MVKRIPEYPPGACGGWPGSEPDDRARQRTPQKPLKKNRWEINIFEFDPPKIIEQLMKNGRSVRTVRTDRPYGPSVRTVRSDRPYGRSVWTVRTNGPYGWSVRTVRTDGPYERSVRTVRTDGPYGPSVRTVQTDRPYGRYVRNFLPPAHGSKNLNGQRHVPARFCS